MSDFIKLLNQNQGVLAIIAIGLTIVSGIIVWFFKKDKRISVHKNSPHIQAGHSVSAGGDIIVGGSKTQLVNENFPTVIIKPDSFIHNIGRFDLIFENTGHSTAIIQKLEIGENNVNVDEFSLSPGQQIRKQFDVSGFKILEEKIDFPNFKLLYKDLSNNKRYKTIGNISQEYRADGKFNLGKISEISFLAVN